MTTTKGATMAAKMTKAERRMVLNAHASYAPKYARYGSAFSSKGTHFATITKAQERGWLDDVYRVTRAALIAAYVDLDAIHAEAITEDEQRDRARRSIHLGTFRESCAQHGCPGCPQPVAAEPRTARGRWAAGLPAAHNILAADLQAAADDFRATQRAAMLAAIRPGSPVIVRHDGREIVGWVTSTAHRGTELLGIGFYARELGHRIDNAINVEPADIIGAA